MGMVKFDSLPIELTGNLPCQMIHRARWEWAESPEVSDKATQQGLLPVEINALERNYFLLQWNAEFWGLTFKWD